MNRTDEQLMLDYQEGQKEALEVIFVRYKKPIFNYALRILKERAEAEDIISEIFLMLFVKKDSYRPEGKFSTWLYTVARNTCISRIRKKSRLFSFWIRSKETNDFEQRDIPDVTFSPERLSEEKETSSFVQMAVNSLPLSQREVIILREYHNMSYEEISQIMQCSLEKVKILIFRARQRLRKKLAFLMKEVQNDRT
ncbi:MAG: sigma-70 family RNA polymerase sigma factor [Candidatus Omnitrophica bacterium]|nr:sigma-70 family RNA polymerase sigma factor [Candidatus Omnitrophota bacterium]